jgi:Zn-dependent peptidase ImmA (M78 family)
MNDAYGEIKSHAWQEIFYAFHTEIKHSVKELQYSQDFTNDMIIRDLLHKTKLPSPVDPFELCRELNILVKQVELPGNIEAFTIKSEFADKGMIVLNHKYGSVRRKKFTLAHEICHFLKHSFPNEANVLVDEKVEVMISQTNEMVQYVNPEWERDANDFAHRLLLPAGSIEEKQLKRIQYNLVNNILSLSEKWEVSMSVLASKIVSVTDIELILIISENGEIVFSQTSPYWEGERISLYNENVPSDSYTYDFIHLQEFAHSSKPHVTNLKIWQEELPNITIREEVFATGYGKVYTFLYK